MKHVALLSLICALPLTATNAQDLASEAAPGSSLSVAEGFQVELVYSVPSDKEGSWVAMAVDSSGRLVTSDQYGKLYRVTLPAISGKEVQVQPINVDVGMAQGLLCAFDSLYVMVNGKGAGLYRVRDTDGDDQYDQVKLLRSINGGGEHGPHAIVLSPDKRSLYVCGGNHTDLPNPEASLVPRTWSEDQLLPRMWDARGHAAGKLAPGGWIARTDPEGSKFELNSIGFRNEYDIAFNTEGELFTYDADMEWDVGTPWYRPTRVNHCTSGSEFGWRSGTGKWPASYPDSLGSVVDIGPGSPTGIAFGTGARFPHQYQRALFISDWSYGIIYAVHMTPHGSSYIGEKEPFVSAAPLPATDIVINPHDGAMYFTIGGRRAQSGLYRVAYVGDQPTTPAPSEMTGRKARQIRKSLESLHYAGAEGAVEKAWPHLASEDRAIRYAARIALEHQPVAEWEAKALAETDPVTKTYAIIALARSAQRHADLLQKAVASLLTTPWAEQSDSGKIDLMRALSLCFMRLGPEDGGLPASLRESVTSYLTDHFPASDFALNRELSQLLVYLQAPGTSARTITLLEQAPTQEEQVHYALVLRALTEGWTLEERKRYFRWFNEAGAARGGASFGGFLKNIREEAIATLDESEKTQLAEILSVRPKPKEAVAVTRTELVRRWTMDDLLPAVQNDSRQRDFEKGKTHFTEAGCYKCHRMAGDGGITGPDLTGAGRRFDHRALLESILEPSKTISDQYQSSQFVLETGKIVTGRVVNLAGKNISVMENMLDPGNHTRVDRSQIERVVPSTVSMMPTGLLDTFQKEEILELLAYLRAGADPGHASFQRSGQ